MQVQILTPLKMNLIVNFLTDKRLFQLNNITLFFHQKQIPLSSFYHLIVFDWLLVPQTLYCYLLKISYQFFSHFNQLAQTGFGNQTQK